MWLEDLASGRRRWKRLCTETFTSVVLYPHHVLLLKQHAIANFASYANPSNENPHARIMLADRRNGNPIFYGKNVVSAIDSVSNIQIGTLCRYVKKVEG